MSSKTPNSGSGAGKRKKYTKSNLPSKVCTICGQPFDWRKKWEKVWDEVKYCSERCRRNRSSVLSQNSSSQSLNSLSSSSVDSRLTSPMLPLPLSRREQRELSDRKYSTHAKFTNLRPVSATFGAAVGILFCYCDIDIHLIPNFGVHVSNPQAMLSSSIKVTPIVRTQLHSLGFAFAAGQTALSTADAQSLLSATEEDWMDTLAYIRRPQNYHRLDESPDSLFYTEPRLVEHIDDGALRALTIFHRKLLSSLQNDCRAKNEQATSSTCLPRVLDLCSSWTSHLPVDLEMYPPQSSHQPPVPLLLSTPLPVPQPPQPRLVVGVGMNEAELKLNRQLTHYLVLNLNEGGSEKALLGFLSSLRESSVHDGVTSSGRNSALFDAVLLQLSVDYLTRPVPVLEAAASVLRPGGCIAISFSNRVFVDKAVAGWTGKSDADHIETVGAYIRLAGTFFDVSNMQAFNLKQEANLSQTGDPIYAVVARKK